MSDLVRSSASNQWVRLEQVWGVLSSAAAEHRAYSPAATASDALPIVQAKNPLAIRVAIACLVTAICATAFVVGRFYRTPEAAVAEGTATGELDNSSSISHTAAASGQNPNIRTTDAGTPKVAPSKVATGDLIGAENVLATDASQTATDVSLEGLIKRIEPAVVQIQTDRATGSGFFIQDGQTVLTNYHVIEGAASARVRFADGSETEVDGYLLVDRDRDLAVLHLKHRREGVTAMRISSQVPNKGAIVYAIGSPNGLSFSASDGIVSAVRSGTELSSFSEASREAYKELGYAQKMTWIQSTAPISSGNSGGPLVDSNGTVVGINTWHLVDGQNLNFAVSSVEFYSLTIVPQVRPLTSLPPQRPAIVKARPTDQRLRLLAQIYDQRLLLLAKGAELDRKIAAINSDLGEAQARYIAINSEGSRLTAFVVALQQEINQISATIPINPGDDIRKQDAINQRQAQIVALRTRYNALDAQALEVRLSAENLGMQSNAANTQLRAHLLECSNLRNEWLAIVDPFGKLRRREHETSIDILSQWIIRDGKNGSAFFARGIAYIVCDEPQKAIADLTRAIELDGGVKAIALAVRGNLLSRQGNLPEANADFAKAFATDKSEPMTFLYRGAAYFRNSQFVEAEKDFRTALQLAPDESEVHRFYAISQIKRTVDKIDAAQLSVVHAQKACDITQNADARCCVRSANRVRLGFRGGADEIGG